MALIGTRRALLAKNPRKPAVASGFSLTAQGSSGTGTIGTSVINYGTVNYGSGNNAILIAIWWYGTGTGDTVNAVSVGGSPATQVSGVFAPNPQSLDLWQLNSPAGSSANITVTYSAPVTYNSNVTIYGLVSTNTSLRSANSTASVGASASVSAAVTVPAGGSAIAIAGDLNGQALSFTNATQDGTYTGGGVSFVWGHTTATGLVTVTATPLALDTNTLGVAAYGP